MDVNRLIKVDTIREFFKIEEGEPLNEGTRALLEAMEEVKFNPGDKIVCYGDGADAGMFIILEGQAEVLSREGAHINEMNPGDFIGEVALINDGKRMATVVATSPMTCANISKELFEKIADANRKIYASFMYMLYTRTTKLVTEQQKIKSELDVATKIQSSLLEHDFSRFNSLPDVHIGAFMKTAKEVGGDFYDVFMIDDKHMCFLIADVSGKSVPGAMFMMMSKTHIKNYASLGMPLDEVVYRVNERLCENNRANMFVTLFVCTLDLETGIVSYVDAGHNLPYISKAGEEFKMLSCEANLVVGMMEDMPYKLQTLELKKGDRIFFYTDGVTEAMNRKDEFYTERRLEEALNSIDKNLSPEEFLEENYRRVEEFTEGAEQSDDITMLYLAR